MDKKQEKPKLDLNDLLVVGGIILMGVGLAMMDNIPVSIFISGAIIALIGFIRIRGRLP